MFLTERIKCNWHGLLKAGINGPSVRNLQHEVFLEEVSLHNLSGRENQSYKKSSQWQHSTFKRPWKKNTQISDETWFVWEEFEACKPSSSAPEIGGANVFISCVMAFKQWTVPLQQVCGKVKSPGKQSTAGPGFYVQCSLLQPK